MMAALKNFLPRAGVWIFWLLPLAGFPLSFARLTGKKVPVFGEVQMVSFTGLAYVALAVILFNSSRLKQQLQNSIYLRLTAIAGVLVIAAAAIQQFLYGGSSEHLYHAVFYAATPLAASAIAPELRRSLPGITSLTAGLLLFSGIMSENFTGLTGNWNWTQILFFAALPGFFIRFKLADALKYSLLALFFFIAAGSLFYPAQLSLTLCVILPLTLIGMWIWNHFSQRHRSILAAIMFALLLAIVCGVSMWKDVSTISDSRIQLFASTGKLLGQHGIIGVGSGRFFDFIQEYITPEYFLAPFAAHHHPHPHNELLHLWSSFGIAGIVFIAVLFCGVLQSCPCHHITLRDLMPVWMFLLIFLCGQTDLTAAIISGAFWMLASAGIAMAPHRKFTCRNSGNRIFGFILLALFLLAAITDFRATYLLRKGQLAILGYHPQNAMKYYQDSLTAKESKEALYRSAEIALHGLNDHGRAFQYLTRLQEKLGYFNYLHSNRMKAVCLVNLNRLPEALEHLNSELQAYPLSIINRRLHLDLLKRMNRPPEEIDSAVNAYADTCRIRGISPMRGNTITMIEDDAPLPSTGTENRQLTYPRLFPGIVSELLAAITLFLAALGSGALCCFRRRRDIMTELAIGIAVCAIAGALLPPSLTPSLLLCPAIAGILCNLEKLRRHWKIVTVFGVLTLFMLPNALLPPHSWDEQVYQIALLKQYAGIGFWNKIADNPYSAYPSLIHAFLLCGFNWGGATLPKLIILMFYALTGIYLFRCFAPKTGKFAAGAIIAALMLSPLSLVLIRNFYVEIFILLFAIAGSGILLKEELPDNSDCLIAGIMAGCSAAIKLTGGGVALGLFILLLFRRREWKAVGYFILGALSAAFVFYLRTWIFYGNPFYPYGSAWFGASESACLVEKFHRLLGGHYGLNALQGTLFGWLFTALKPELYDGISCGFQFPLFFIAGIGGAYLAGKQDVRRRWFWFGSIAAMVTVYLFWGLTSRQSRFIYPVFFASALLALTAAEQLSPLWKRILAILALIATVISLIINSHGMLMHYYFSCRVFANARKIPAGFAATREHGYARLLHQINALPDDARIALIAERRTLYMPRQVTILLPHFQEELTPLPESPAKLFETLKKFDYLVIRIPSSDVDRAPEYDDELNKLYAMLQQLLNQGKLEAQPDSEMMILRVVTSAAGTASFNSSASSVSRHKTDARFRRADGKPLPRR